MRNKTKIDIEVRNDQLYAEWIGEQNAPTDTKYKYSLTGEIRNNSALITYKSEPVDKTESYSFLSSADSVTYDCFAYIEPDQKEINIKSKDPDKNFVLKLHRKLT